MLEAATERTDKAGWFVENVLDLVYFKTGLEGEFKSLLV